MHSHRRHPDGGASGWRSAWWYTPTSTTLTATGRILEPFLGDRHTPRTLSCGTAVGVEITQLCSLPWL